MKLSPACAILAPALASAAAFALPEPTQPFAAPDNWSPAPTAAPQINLFAREAQQANQDNTCGYLSGLSASPISCPNPQAICATNTFYGVHGCCDTSALSSCIIPTTCIASTAMPSLCTDSTCTSDAAIAKCTASTAAECYKYLIVYASTTMTQHGCTAAGFTSTAYRSYGPTTSDPVRVVTVTASASPAVSPTSTAGGSGGGGGGKKPTLAPIIGGTIGGCTIVSLVALAAFLIHRRRATTRQHAAAHPPPSTQFHHPHSGTGAATDAAEWVAQDGKAWPVSSAGAAHGPWVGIAEVHGVDRAVEVEAREGVKCGWEVGRAPVEVEAPLGRREGEEREKKGWRGGPVEAPS